VIHTADMLLPEFDWSRQQTSSHSHHYRHMTPACTNPTQHSQAF